MTDWEFVEEDFFPVKKALEIQDLPAFREKNWGKKIVFTNGFFDLLHVGHVFFLHRAKQLGDILVVGLNSDTSIHKEDPFAPKKEKVGRIINDQACRAIMLTSLFFVDFVTTFDDPNPEQIIRFLKPDILVKGLDWKGKKIAGMDFMRRNGGQVCFLDSGSIVTTTGLIEKIGQIYFGNK